MTPLTSQQTVQLLACKSALGLIATVGALASIVFLILQNKNWIGPSITFTAVHIAFAYFGNYAFVTSLIVTYIALLCLTPLLIIHPTSRNYLKTFLD